MPFLSLVHLRELRCPECSDILAQAGARSFIVNPEGSPIGFAEGDPPAECWSSSPAKMGTFRS